VVTPAAVVGVIVVGDPVSVVVVASSVADRSCPPHAAAGTNAANAASEAQVRDRVIGPTLRPR